MFSVHQVLTSVFCMAYGIWLWQIHYRYAQLAQASQQANQINSRLMECCTFSACIPKLLQLHKGVDVLLLPVQI